MYAPVKMQRRSKVNTGFKFAKSSDKDCHINKFNHIGFNQRLGNFFAKNSFYTFDNLAMKYYVFFLLRLIT